MVVRRPVRADALVTTLIGLGVIVSGIFGRVDPAAAAGASLNISPAGGTYQVGGLLDVSFVVDTGGESINAVAADVLFPPDKLQVVNPVASTSFISVWVAPPAYSNTDGTIHFQGGLPNPGIKTSGGVISTVSFRVKAPGRAIIKYAPTSKVLRNDGEGTNILTSTSSAEFTLKIPPPAGPLVSSPTHPDQNLWYNNPQVQLTWEPAENAGGYSSSFDQTAKSTPDETVDTTSTATSVKASSDGVWYFHLRAKTDSWGGTTSYPIQIDTTPPAAYTPKLDRDVVTVQDSGTLRFLTSDAASGIDHYEVKEVTNDTSTSTLFVEAGSPYTISQHPAGNYEYIVRAFDRAGNFTDSSAKLTVVAGGLPFLARVPLLRNPAVANGAIIVLGGGVLASIGLAVLRRVRIRSTFHHDLATLERDARHKSEVLQRELEELRQAQQLVQQDLAPPVSSPPPVAIPPSPSNPASAPPPVSPSPYRYQPPTPPFP